VDVIWLYDSWGAVPAGSTALRWRLNQPGAHYTVVLPPAEQDRQPPPPTSRVPAAAIQLHAATGDVVGCIVYVADSRDSTRMQKGAIVSRSHDGNMVQVQFEDWSYHLEPRWVHLSTASTWNVWTILPHSSDTDSTADDADDADDADEPSPHSAGELNRNSSAIPGLVSSPGERGYGIPRAPSAVTGQGHPESSGLTDGSESKAATNPARGWVAALIAERSQRLHAAQYRTVLNSRGDGSGGNTGDDDEGTGDGSGRDSDGSDDGGSGACDGDGDDDDSDGGGGGGNDGDRAHYPAGHTLHTPPGQISRQRSQPLISQSFANWITREVTRPQYAQNGAGRGHTPERTTTTTTTTTAAAAAVASTAAAATEPAAAAAATVAMAAPARPTSMMPGRGRGHMATIPAWMSARMALPITKTRATPAMVGMGRGRGIMATIPAWMSHSTRPQSRAQMGTTVGAAAKHGVGRGRAATIPAWMGHSHSPQSEQTTTTATTATTTTMAAAAAAVAAAATATTETKTTIPTHGAGRGRGRAATIPAWKSHRLHPPPHPLSATKTAAPDTAHAVPPTKPSWQAVNLAHFLAWQRRLTEPDERRRYGSATGHSTGRCFRCGKRQRLQDLLHRTELCCSKCRRRWETQVIWMAHEYSNCLNNLTRGRERVAANAVKQAPFDQFPKTQGVT
jgi:hypothetical protein